MSRDASATHGRAGAFVGPSARWKQGHGLGSDWTFETVRRPPNPPNPLDGQTPTSIALEREEDGSFARRANRGWQKIADPGDVPEHVSAID